MDGAEFHRLEALGGEAGEELLARSVGEERVAEELSAVRQLVTLCAGLPLAVCLAAARLASRPEQSIASLVDVLAPDTGRLVQLEIDGEVTVGRALDASYEVLNAAAALLYRRLGPLPMHTYDVWTAAVVCSQSLAWAEERLYELVEANLLEDMGVEGFRFHDLVRVHARQRARDTDDDTSVRQTLRRAADWYLLSTTAAERRLTPIQLTLPRTYAHLIVLPEPFSDDEGALRWLDRQRTNLMAVVRASADQGWHPTTWQLVDAMWPLFLRLRHYELWNEAHDIGLEAARDDGNAEAERQMLNSGAIGLSAAGRTGEAADWYTASLAAARAAGDVRDEGQALLGLGGCRSEQGRPAEAVSYLNRAVRSWEACGYPRGVALAQIVLGEIALAGQDTAAAVECFTEARETLLHVDDPHDATRALAFLGRARAANGERGAGTAQMENALAVFTASGALHWQARTLEMLGDSAAEGGTAGTATELRARARVLYELTSPADARRLAQGGCLDRT
jgi:tetratricopeptide (TPR) repeat protein